MSFSHPHRSFADLALAAYLQPAAEGRSVLWLGEAATGAPDHLAHEARRVQVLDPTGEQRLGEGGKALVAALRPGPLALREDSFDIVVVPEFGVFGSHADERLRDLGRLLAEGGLVAIGLRNPDLPRSSPNSPENGDEASPNGSEQGGAAWSYEDFYAQLRQRFDAVQMLGQAPFSGYQLVDFARADADTAVTLDGSLAEEAEPTVERFVALCGAHPSELDAFFVAQLPDSMLPTVATLAGAGSDLEQRLTASHAQLRAVEDKLTSAGSLKERFDARVSELEHDYRTLESALLERGQRVSNLQSEVGRRGKLVRDLVERLGLPEGADGSGGGGSGGDGGSGGFDVPPAGGTGATNHSGDERHRFKSRAGGNESTARPSTGDAGGDPRSTFAEESEQREAGAYDPVQRALAAEAAQAELQFRVDDLEARLQEAKQGETHRAEEDARALRQTVQARDALIARLQMDLAETEQSTQLVEGRTGRLVEENERLRRGLLAAADADQLNTGLQDQIRSLETDRRELQARLDHAIEERRHLTGALFDTRRVLSEIDLESAGGGRTEVESGTLEITAVGADTPPGVVDDLSQVLELQAQLERLQGEVQQIPTLRERAELLNRQLEAVQSRADGLEEALATCQGKARAAGDRVRELEAQATRLQQVVERTEGVAEEVQQLRRLSADAVAAKEQLGVLRKESAGRESLLLSMTEQLEERDERIRSLERRMGGSPTAEGEEAETLSKELGALQQRLASLNQQLATERAARRTLEGAESVALKGQASERELQRLNNLVGLREGEVLRLQGRMNSFEHDVRRMRETAAEARGRIETLLGTGQPGAAQPDAADWLGELMQLLGHI